MLSCFLQLKFIVLPEAAIHGYLSQDLQQSWHVKGRPLTFKIHGNSHEKMDSFMGDLSQSAETVPGVITDHYCELSKELNVYIVVPFIEKEKKTDHVDDDNDDVRFYNSCVLTTPDGQLGLQYRKNNLWPLIDFAWATAGKEMAVIDTPYGRVGLAICYDVHVMLERYSRENLWSLLYPIAWVDDLGSDWFESELPKRVKQAGFHVVGANWSVEQAYAWNGYGFSRVIRSDGTILAAARTQIGDEIVIADLEY